MVSGIKGNTIKFAGRAIIDNSPVIFRIIGRTAICVETVADTISLNSNLLGRNFKIFEMNGDKLTKPRLAMNDNWNDGS